MAGSAFFYKFEIQDRFELVEKYKVKDVVTRYVSIFTLFLIKIGLG